MSVVSEKILAILKKHNIDYETIEHEGATTCEEASALRNMPLRYGGKSILFKDKSTFRLFTLPANRKVENAKVRKILKSQKLRFATKDELKELAQVEKGALPPISKDLYSFDHYIDKSLLENELIVFNAGILTLTVILKMSDYLKIIDATFCEFSSSLD